MGYALIIRETNFMRNKDQIKKALEYSSFRAILYTPLQNMSS